MPTGDNRTGSPSPTPSPACASSSGAFDVPASVRWRSNVPMGRWSTRSWRRELTVIVIAPNQIKNLRSRYGSAGNKDDGFDAFVLADTLRTDRSRLRPLTRDSEATITLRMAVRARQDLVAARVAMANQLRAHLQTTLPGAIGLFRDIDSAITPEVPDQVPQPRQARLAQRDPAGQLAALGRLQPPVQPRAPLAPPPRRPTRHLRRRGCCPSPDHPGPGHRAHRDP